MNTKQIVFLVVITSILITVPGCDGDLYHGFGCIAPESHPAVAEAKLLTSEQLETVYIEVQKLSKEHAKENYEKQFLKSEIPSNLNFLNADLIRVYRSRGPYIILANCFDERIELTLSQEDETEASITLHWAEPTNENPYARGSQILWKRNNDG